MSVSEARQVHPVFKILLWGAMAVILLSVLAAVVLTNVTLRSIEKNLPANLLQELYDLEQVLDKLKQAFFAAQLTRAANTPEHFTRLKKAVQDTFDAIVRLRHTYVFDNMVEASAFHAVVAPAVSDAKIWLSEGVSGYAPESETTIDICLKRISDACAKAEALKNNSQKAARGILNQQLQRLEHFLVSVNLLFVLTLVITAILVALLIRQNRLQKVQEKTRTELQQAKLSLQESVEFYDKLIAAIPDVVVRCDVDGVILQCNQASLQIGGYTKEEMVGKNTLDFIAPEDYERALENSMLMFERQLGPREYHFVMKNGRKVEFEVNSDILRHEDGVPYGVVNVCRDITERRKAEKELFLSENRFRLTFEHAPLGMAIIDIRRRFVEVNARLCDMLGYTPREMVGRTLDEFTHPDDLGGGRIRWQQMVEGERDFSQMEKMYMRKDGRTLWVIVSNTVVRGDEKEPLYFISHLMDISARKLAEKRRIRAQSLLEAAIEQSPAGILIADAPNVKIRVANSVALGIQGESKRPLNYIPKELHPDNWQVLKPDGVSFAPDELPLIKAIVKGETLRNVEAVIRRPDGSERWISANAAPVLDDKGDIVSGVAVFLDITDQKKAQKDKALLERRLQQAQKMEALGTLAGGIAHNFNNLMMGIQGNASLMLMDCGPESPHHERIRHIERHIQMGVDLTRQLLGLARGGKYEVRVTDINKLLRNCSMMFGRTRKEIVFHESFDKDAWLVEVDRGQVQQVMLNLFINAWQAMSDGGDIYLQTANVALNPQDARVYHLTAGNYLKISCTDTGPGIDKDTQNKIFDPFFTTKDKERGTGLGLASAYGIIRNHKGMITVYSEPDKGATFNIYLPASSSAADPEDVQTCGVLTGGETVLLVDDEPLVIEVGKSLLERLGYQVLIADSGKGAVEIFRDHSEGIDLVILDMIMPGKSGTETFMELKAVRKDVTVLLSSGYSLNGYAVEILNKGCDGFIQKPFSIQMLSAKIREVLDKDR